MITFRFLSSISLNIYPLTHILPRNSRPKVMVASSKRTADGFIWFIDLRVSWAPLSFANFRALLVGVIARSGGASAQGALVWLRWIFWTSVSFRVARPISDVYDFPSGCYSWEISRYHPNGIISVFSPIPCFSFLNTTRNVPLRTATSSPSHDFALHFYKYYKFSDFKWLALRFFEAAAYHRK